MSYPSAMLTEQLLLFGLQENPSFIKNYVKKGNFASDFKIDPAKTTYMELLCFLLTNHHQELERLYRIEGEVHNRRN